MGDNSTGGSPSKRKSQQLADCQSDNYVEQRQSAKSRVTSHVTDEEKILSQISCASVSSALDGFALDSKRSIDQLTLAIREGLRLSLIFSRDVSWVTSPDFNRYGPTGGPDRKGRSITQKELNTLADKTRQLSHLFNHRSPEASDVLWRHAFWKNPHEGREQPSEHERFLHALKELDWVAGHLQGAAARLKPDRPKYRSRERFEQRVFHAHALAAVFEWAFKRPATIISWQGSLDGPWPDFFQRTNALAFGGRKISNATLSKILKEARRRVISSGSLWDPNKLFE